MAIESQVSVIVDPDELAKRVDDLLASQSQRYRRLWMYYRNPMLPRTLERDEQGSDRPYRQGQEWGLPSRVTGVRSGLDPLLSQSVDGVARKEVVIENDIAWRIDTMVDFLFGKPITVGSLCTDPARRAQIETLLDAILQHNGGGLLLQQLALLGAVYGFVDVLVKFDSEQAASVPTTLAEPAPSMQEIETEESHPRSRGVQLAHIARSIRLEIVEPARALPVLSETDWRQVKAYAQVWRIARKPSEHSSPAKSGWYSRVIAHLAARSAPGFAEEFATVTEILSPTQWQRFEDGKLVAEGANSLGQIPLVHIQNLAMPFQYSGTSDVEPMIGLQDELNTRLCDRANRITMQSFKMYLGKGIDGFTDLPVAPGRMWVTDNDAADVVEFGGDPSSPSEDQHISELREAMDKISGVTPIAAGAIRGRIGNLTSAAALRVTMMALLAKTERKRTTYGRAIEQICELALAWLDRAGLFPANPDDRRVEIHWPALMPDSETERLRDAQIKQSLGVPQDVLLRELGYAPSLPLPSGECRGEGAAKNQDAQISEPPSP